MTQGLLFAPRDEPVKLPRPGWPGLGRLDPLGHVWVTSGSGTSPDLGKTASGLGFHWLAGLARPRQDSKLRRTV